MNIGGFLGSGLGSVGHLVGKFVPLAAVELVGSVLGVAVVSVVLLVLRSLRSGPG